MEIAEKDKKSEIDIKNKNIGELKEWYIKNIPLYEDLASKVELIIKEVLNQNEISYFSISSRAKTLESFMDKSQKDKYKDPLSEIMDFAGIRVITYFKSEVKECCSEIEKLFDIDKENSLDKGNELGTEKMGYRSVHYIATLKKDRLCLPEYYVFRDKKFEIQVRTILEHAWADISHDRNYKFNGVLPEEIQRRFALVAATLELSDREFDSIALELSKYEKEVEEKIKNNELDIEINSASLKEYLKNKLESYEKESLIIDVDFINEQIVIDELIRFGVKKIYDVDKLLEKYLEKYIIELKKAESKYLDMYYIEYANDITYMGFIRNMMLIENIDFYFEKVWNNSWNVISFTTVEMIENILGQTIKEKINSYGIYIH